MAMQNGGAATPARWLCTTGLLAGRRVAINGCAEGGERSPRRAEQGWGEGACEGAALSSCAAIACPYRNPPYK
jgi:hypothetical protein